MKQIVEITRQDIFDEIGNVCYLLGVGRQPDTDRGALVSDVLDDGNIELVGCAVAEGFDEVVALLDPFFGNSVETLSGPGFGPEESYRLEFEPGDDWTAAMTRQLKRHIHRYLVERALWWWLTLMGLAELSLHESLMADALSRIRMLAMRAGGARIVPRPF